MTVRYWPYFCEENVWHLCADGAIPQSRVVFVSNPQKRVAMRKQRAGGRGVVLWDYHVVLLAGGQVWDLDTTLGCPIALDRWIEESFQPLRPGFEPRFRVIDAADYLREFASDRSHMVGPDGVPLKPLPPWPRIGVGMNLMRFTDMETPFLGEVVDLEGLQGAE